MIGAYTNCYFKCLSLLTKTIIHDFLIFSITILKWSVVLLHVHCNIVKIPYTFKFTIIALYKCGYSNLQPISLHLIMFMASLYTLR